MTPAPNPWRTSPTHLLQAPRPKDPSPPPWSPSPRLLQPPTLFGALTGLALLPPGAGRRRGRCGAATSLQLVRWGRRRGGHGVGDPGQRRRGMDAPLGRTIARKGCRGRHRPPRCGRPEHVEGQAPSRSAKCALFPALLPARGRSHRNRNSARPPPLSLQGEAGTGLDPPRAPRGVRAVPLRDRGGRLPRGRARARSAAHTGAGCPPPGPDRTNRGRRATAPARGPHRQLERRSQMPPCRTLPAHPAPAGGRQFPQSQAVSAPLLSAAANNR